MAIRGSSLAGAVIPVGGPAGLPGQGTYDAWRALGNTGSLADFMAAQKGAPGGVTTLAGKVGALGLDDINALAKNGDAGDARVQPGGSTAATALKTILGRRRWASDFQAIDLTGVTECAAALQAAIDAMSPYGGVLVIPAGSRIKIGSTIHIHNGSATTVSTRNGTRIEGDCAVASYSVAAQFGFPARQNRNSVELVWAGPANGIMVQVDGGDGGAVKRILFDGAGITGVVGLKVISAQNFEYKDLSFLYCALSILSTTVPNILATDLPGGGLYHLDSLRNRWDGIFISMPPGGVGIKLDGADVNDGTSSDTDFNDFGTVQIADSGSAGSGQAIVLRNADANIFRNVTCTLANPNSNAVVLDYRGATNGILPTSNKIYHIDWGATPTTPVLVIDPNGVAKGTNAIAGILPVNGGYANPTVHPKVYESDDTIRVSGGRVFAETSLVTPLLDMPAGASHNVNLYYSGGWKFKANGQGYLIGYNATAGYVSHYITAVNSAGAGAAATLIEYLRIYQDGGVVFNGYTNASGGLTVPFGAPASATAPGKQGEIRMDGSYIYVCVATNSWRRIANGAAW